MSCLWNSFLEFVSLLIVRFHNIFCDDLPYWKSIFLLVIVLRLLFHCYIYFTRAKPHPTRPVLLMPKPEVIIYTSRHHILSPLELNFSMNHPIYQVNCMLTCLPFRLVAWHFLRFVSRKYTFAYFRRDLFVRDTTGMFIYFIFVFLVISCVMMYVINLYIKFQKHIWFNVMF